MEGKGFGLIALQDISAGSFVLEYIGEVLKLTSEEGVRRQKANQRSNCTYMMSIENGLVIDPTFKGGMARFINHSCDPNCETLKWHVKGEVRIGIFSKRKIRRGEELSFNYNFDVFCTAYTPCLCQASNCKGFLGTALPEYSQQEWNHKLDNLACRVCGSSSDHKSNQLILCDDCNEGYHSQCIGLSEVPASSFICKICEKKNQSKKQNDSQSSQDQIITKRKDKDFQILRSIFKNGDYLYKINYEAQVLNKLLQDLSKIYHPIKAHKNLKCSYSIKRASKDVGNLGKVSVLSSRIGDYSAHSYQESTSQEVKSKKMDEEKQLKKIQQQIQQASDSGIDPKNGLNDNIQESSPPSIQEKNERRKSQILKISLKNLKNDLVQYLQQEEKEGLNQKIKDLRTKDTIKYLNRKGVDLVKRDIPVSRIEYHLLKGYLLGLLHNLNKGGSISIYKGSTKIEEGFQKQIGVMAKVINVQVTASTPKHMKVVEYFLEKIDEISKNVQKTLKIQKARIKLQKILQTNLFGKERELLFKLEDKHSVQIDVFNSDWIDEANKEEEITVEIQGSRENIMDVFQEIQSKRDELRVHTLYKSYTEYKALTYKSINDVRAEIGECEIYILKKSLHLKFYPQKIYQNPESVEFAKKNNTYSIRHCPVYLIGTDNQIQTAKKIIDQIIKKEKRRKYANFQITLTPNRNFEKDLKSTIRKWKVSYYVEQYSEKKDIFFFELPIKYMKSFRSEISVKMVKNRFPPLWRYEMMEDLNYFTSWFLDSNPIQFINKNNKINFQKNPKNSKWELSYLRSSKHKDFTKCVVDISRKGNWRTLFQIFKILSSKIKDVKYALNLYNSDILDFLEMETMLQTQTNKYYGVMDQESIVLEHSIFDKNEIKNFYRMISGGGFQRLEERFDEIFQYQFKSHKRDFRSIVSKRTNEMKGKVDKWSFDSIQKKYEAKIKFERQSGLDNVIKTSPPSSSYISGQNDGMIQEIKNYDIEYPIIEASAGHNSQIPGNDGGSIHDEELKLGGIDASTEKDAKIDNEGCSKGGVSSLKKRKIKNVKSSLEKTLSLDLDVAYESLEKVIKEDKREIEKSPISKINKIGLVEISSLECQKSLKSESYYSIKGVMYIGLVKLSKKKIKRFLDEIPDSIDNSIERANPTIEVSDKIEKKIENFEQKKSFKNLEIEKFKQIKPSYTKKFKKNSRINKKYDKNYHNQRSRSREYDRNRRKPNRYDKKTYKNHKFRNKNYQQKYPKYSKNRYSKPNHYPKYNNHYIYSKKNTEIDNNYNQNKKRNEVGAPSGIISANSGSSGRNHLQNNSKSQNNYDQLDNMKSGEAAGDNTNANTNKLSNKD